MTTRIYKEGGWEIVEAENQNTILGKRVVVFFDILGFKKLIKNNSLIDLANKYEEVVNQIQRTNRPSETKNRPILFADHPLDVPYCKTFIFSDSIIIVSNGPSQSETLKTLVFAWRTLQQFIVHGLTARGAVTYGEIYINPSKNIFLGIALTDAYELEQNQEWIGAVIDNNVFESFPDLKSEVDITDSFFSKLFLKYSVPFKDKSRREYYTLNWRANLMLEEGVKSLFKYTDNPIIDVKFDNTMEYCKNAKHFSHKDTTPIELSIYWRGKTKPPFIDPD